MTFKPSSPDDDKVKRNRTSGVNLKAHTIRKKKYNDKRIKIPTVFHVSNLKKNSHIV